MTSGKSEMYTHPFVYFQCFLPTLGLIGTVVLVCLDPQLSSLGGTTLFLFSTVLSSFFFGIWASIKTDSYYRKLQKEVRKDLKERFGYEPRF